MSGLDPRHPIGALRIMRLRLLGTSTNSRLARGAAWSVAGAGISRACLLLGAIVTARILEREGYGRFGLIQMTLAMFQAFAGAGMGATATKYISQYRLSDPLRAGGVGLLSQWIGGITAAGVGGLLFLYSKEVAVLYLGDISLHGPLRVASIGLFFATLTGAQNGILAGLGAFHVLARVGVVSGIASLMISVLGVVLWGVDGAVWALVISAAFQWVLTGISVRESLRVSNIVPQWRHAKGQLRVMWTFALPAVLSGIMVSPVNWWVTAMLARQSSGLSELGGFNAANQWLALIAFIPGRISAVAMPMISEKLGEGDRGGAAVVLKASLVANAVVAAPLVLVISLLSKVIMGAYGQDFAGDWICLIIVAVTGGIVALSAPLGDLIAASESMWIGLAMNASWAVAFVSLVYLLNANVALSAIGLAAARLAAYAMHAVWVTLYGRRQLIGDVARIE